ncbi:energy-coupling factor ABC transporter ATP-binding protein [Bacillus carboniphilus]|uniref:Energy-coupling factor transporter ATP-binding protein EcfA2 n=1 Tax=Bacillus carboniphilus TaxID=86663 RepID=A0ABY9JRI4_9BACI|nr:energy-coupling factor ABC transporter ATP-binding protein [Bacillus carboniphilus]WLR42010.1 energy-coupling factor ABC transporter ATP-binding protein [Bacillus carboniphilus]
MDIKISNLEHYYQKKTPFEYRALYDVNLTIKHGTYLAIIGHTGSGKSTLLQHLNGLLLPTTGTVEIGDQRLEAGKKNKQIKEIRRKVGILFQFPEHQLFEETVEKDIAFGPKNNGLSDQEAREKVYKAIEEVGISENLLSRSPFELSGGQMRRVAIAGVLAMEPEVLVLDEPTAGLDPIGRVEMMDMFYELHKRKNRTTILVTHSMEDAAKYADEIAIMHKGTIKVKGTPKQIFQMRDQIKELGLDLPESIKLVDQLENRFDCTITDMPFTLEETVALIQIMMKEDRER